MAHKLTPTQQTILENAADRQEGLILPLPDSVKTKGAARLKCLQSLLDRGFIEETVGMPVWRPGDDGKDLTLRITDAGQTAVGETDRGSGDRGDPSADPTTDDDHPTPDTDSPANAATDADVETMTAVDTKVSTEVTPTRVRTAKRGNKTDVMLTLLRRKQGATVAALQDATGWQPHSVRAALTGLRKKGINLVRDKNGKGLTIYRVEA